MKANFDRLIDGATGAAQWYRGDVNVTARPKERGRTSKRRSQKRYISRVQAPPFRALLTT